MVLGLCVSLISSCERNQTTQTENEPMTPQDTTVRIDTTAVIDSITIIAGRALSHCAYPVRTMAGVLIELRLSDSTLYAVTKNSGVFRFTVPSARNCDLVLPGRDSVHFMASEIHHGDSLWVELNSRISSGPISPGALTLMPVDTLQLATLADVILPLGLVPRSLAHFAFVTPYISVDSARATHAILVSKPYFSDWPPQLNERGDSSTVTTVSFNNLDSTGLREWLALSKALAMVDLMSPRRSVELRGVPPGHECEWCGLLGMTGIAQYVELNHLSQSF